MEHLDTTLHSLKWSNQTERPGKTTNVFQNEFRGLWSVAIQATFYYTTGSILACLHLNVILLYTDSCLSGTVYTAMEDVWQLNVPGKPCAQLPMTEQSHLRQ